MIGVNTDSDFSTGFFCALNKSNFNQNLQLLIKKILNDEVSIRLLDRHMVIKENKKRYFFINDLYFGEKHLGSVTKFSFTPKEKVNLKVKATGLLCSTCYLYLK